MSQTLPTSNATRPMTGGQALAEMLKVAGIGPIFGMGGFQLLPFYEACRVLGLRAHPDQRRALRRIRGGCLRQGDQPAWLRRRDARAGRRPISSPGWSRASTPASRSSPSSATRTASMPTKNMTQETRQLEILRPVVKEVIRVEVIEPHPGARAPRVCGGDQRPAGPVLIDVPEDIAHGEHDFDAADFWIDPRDDARRPAAASAPDCKGRRGRRRADRQSQAADDPGRRRRAHLGAPMPRWQRLARERRACRSRTP